MSERVLQSMEELESELPNGLHDARLLGIAHDYVGATVTLELELWISELQRDGDDHYRAARLTFRNPPPLPPVPQGCFCNAFFINDWNASIYIAARGVALQWTGESETSQA